MAEVAAAGARPTVATSEVTVAAEREDHVVLPALVLPDPPSIAPELGPDGLVLKEPNANQPPAKLENRLHQALDPPVVKALRAALEEPNTEKMLALEGKAEDALTQMPAKNSDAMRALLKFWVEGESKEEGGFRGHPALSKAVQQKLTDAGFDIPPRAYGTPRPQDVPELIVRNSGRAPPSVNEIKGMFAGGVDDRRWKETVLPNLWRVPKTSSPQMRALVTTYGDPNITLSPEASRGMGKLLKESGYDVPTDRRPTPLEAERAIASAVHETDPHFAKLSSVVGNESTTIGVGLMDGGFDVKHPALKNKLATNSLEVAGNRKDDDKNGYVDDVHGIDPDKKSGNLEGDGRSMAHGSNVAGIATMGTDRIKAVGVVASAQDIEGQVDYAIAHGAKIINLSMDYESPETMARLRHVMEARPGTLFTMAARNDGSEISAVRPEILGTYEKLDNLIVVAAHDANGARIPESNWGAKHVTLAAQTGVLAPHEAGMYSKGTMTSMATPKVSNAAGKMMLLDGDLSPADVRKLLVASVDRRPDWTGKVESNGVMNEARALNAAAMTALLRQGKSPAEASEALGLSGAEQARVVAMAQGL